MIEIKAILHEYCTGSIGDYDGCCISSARYGVIVAKIIKEVERKIDKAGLWSHKIGETIQEIIRETEEL